MARAAGMSHANVYRHFASKAALQDAVAEAWLHRISDPLATIVTGSGSASERLLAWLLALAEAKRRKVQDDPELFATYAAVVEDRREVVDRHVSTLREQVVAILASGVAAGEYVLADVEGAAAAVLQATTAFHHPEHVRAAGGACRADEVRRVAALLNAGLRVGVV